MRPYRHLVRQDSLVVNIRTLLIRPWVFLRNYVDLFDRLSRFYFHKPIVKYLTQAFQLRDIAVFQTDLQRVNEFFIQELGRSVQFEHIDILIEIEIFLICLFHELRQLL